MGFISLPKVEISGAGGRPPDKLVALLDALDLENARAAVAWGDLWRFSAGNCNLEWGYVEEVPLAMIVAPHHWAKHQPAEKFVKQVWMATG
jgi:hypothetical protein